MECPCKDCLIIPICRNKSWSEVVMTCKLLSNYIHYSYAGKKLKKLKSPIIEIKEINHTLVITRIEKESVSVGVHNSVEFNGVLEED